ncbi:hypothetical protein HanRHA438_Chr17g0814641 [Helianthus annuus]|nr:hypothetical protein HanIR_Chr17g0872821 [Helianthus annuus]KAJ0826470.1 hypothetical protein HanRHA438_Chr17g0814641 [Helianthus annuus]
MRSSENEQFPYKYGYTVLLDRLLENYLCEISLERESLERESVGLGLCEAMT